MPIAGNRSGVRVPLLSDPEAFMNQLANGYGRLFGRDRDGVAGGTGPCCRAAIAFGRLCPWMFGEIWRSLQAIYERKKCQANADRNTQFRTPLLTDALGEAIIRQKLDQRV